MAVAGETHVVEVAERVFAHVQADGGWFVNNTGFMVGRSGVVSVDTCATADRTSAYLRAISDVTDRPVRTLVNTHHHGDHTYGNYLLPGATIVGHQKVRDALLAWGRPPAPAYWEPVDWGHVELAPPFLTYESELRVYVDQMRCDVRYVGRPAHTVADSIVWLPQERVLFAGDLLFNGVTPLMSHGSVSGALAVLDDLEALSPEVVVPGHGPVGGASMIGDVRGYLRLVQDLAVQGRAAGCTPLETARGADLGEYAGWLDAERVVGNLHRAYAELAGCEPGARIDLGAAFEDMVALNGGRPLTCHA
ncbi:MBL fold metallo-hydrolase [Nocardioides korecus]